jgi:hypothetical protein
LLQTACGCHYPDCSFFACSIYEKIGKGKHSVVYKGRKKKTIQYHAIKSVDKSQKAWVLQEVGVLVAVIVFNNQVG